MKALKHKPASIPKSRWLAYATAGAASAFVCTRTTAEATIHYSGLINQKFTGYSGARFQLDQRDHVIRFSHIPNQTAHLQF